jgi:tRNA(Arg) A34 adenosine deaminase TadA
MPKRKYTILAKVSDSKKNTIGVGVNEYRKTHPLQSHFANLAGEPKREYLHAEIQALIRCKDKIPFSIQVERYDSEGNPALAKPCNVCMCAIKAYGVKFIKYTTKNGVVTEKVSDEREA